MNPEAVYDSLAADSDATVHDLADDTPTNKKLLNLSRSSSSSSSTSRSSSSVTSVASAIKEGLTGLFDHIDKRRNVQPPPSPLATTPSPQSVMYDATDRKERLNNRRVNTVVRLRKRLGETLSDLRKFKAAFPDCMQVDSEYYEEYALLIAQKVTLSDAVSNANSLLTETL